MILPNFPGPSLGDIICRIALSIFPVARISFNVDPLPHALSWKPLRVDVLNEEWAIDLPTATATGSQPITLLQFIDVLVETGFPDAINIVARPAALPFQIFYLFDSRTLWYWRRMLPIIEARTEIDIVILRSFLLTSFNDFNHKPTTVERHLFEQQQQQTKAYQVNSYLWSWSSIWF